MSAKPFFTGDTHFNHANVIKYCARPFASVEEMNRAMIERWNSVVGVDVWDFTPRTIEELVTAAEDPKEFKCRYCGAVVKRLQRHPAHRDGKCTPLGVH